MQVNKGLFITEPRGVMVKALTLRLERSRVQLPSVPPPSGQVVHTRASVTKQYNLVPVAGQQCPANGKVTVVWCRTLALSMRHRLKWFTHLRAQDLSKGDEHPTNTAHGVRYSMFTEPLVDFRTYYQLMIQTCRLMDQTTVIWYVFGCNHWSSFETCKLFVLLPTNRKAK